MLCCWFLASKHIWGRKNPSKTKIYMIFARFSSNFQVFGYWKYRIWFLTPETPKTSTRGVRPSLKQRGSLSDIRSSLQNTEKYLRTPGTPLNPFRYKPPLKNFGQKWVPKIGPKFSIRRSPTEISDEPIILDIISRLVLVDGPLIENFGPIFGTHLWPKCLSGRLLRKGLITKRLAKSFPVFDKLFLI